MSMDILIDGETRHMIFVEVDVCNPDEWIVKKTDDVPPDDETRMALELGQKVLALADGCDLSSPMWKKESESEHASVTIVCQRKELKGKKWLESLPAGTIIQPEGHVPILILWDGFLYKSGGRWLWSNVTDRKTSDWIGLACPETCPIQAPE